MHTLVLLSGGLDSLACIVHYRLAGKSVSGLFIDYGQPAAKHEIAAVSRLATVLHLPVATVTVNGIAINRGFIRGRNALLLQLGLMHSADECGIVALGVHAGTSYADCSPYFIYEAQRMFNIYMDGAIQVDAPFLAWTKREIWEFLLKYDAPVDLTYSCERGGDQPCNQCLSCQDIHALWSR
jgi:7-cyano-7-deazaguanine synthase